MYVGNLGPYGFRWLLIFVLVFISGYSLFNGNISFSVVLAVLATGVHHYLFGFGFSETRNDVLKLIKHIKGESESAFMVVTNVHAGYFRKAAIHIVRLKKELPEYENELELSRQKLANYLQNKPWWHF